MNTMKMCSGCQKALPEGAPDGLCPECLLKAGLGTGVDLGPDTQAESGQPSFVAPSLDEVARMFPQLEMLGFIGQGGMGAVYKARQKALERVVALKILPPGIGKDPAFAERFAREAKALARLNHPGVVAIYEFGQADGLFFFLMEFVDGMTLRRLLEVERISPREALAIVPQICDALQYAHDQGIVHRDIKPENILLDRQGRVKVADFGLAKLVGTGAGGSPLTPALSPRGGEGGPNLTDAGKVMGTPQYMAPEQRDHPTEVDHRADIYSLGVVLYQMLTGELPGKPIEAPSRKVRIDVRLDEVVLRALEKEPQRRYQQASQVRAAVETISMGIEKSEVRNERSATAAACSDALARELRARDCVLDIGSCLHRGWNLVQSDFWPITGVTTLILVLLHPGGFLVAGPLLGWLCLFFLKKIRGEPASLEAVFSAFRIAFIMPLFLAGLAGAAAALILILSLVIPLRLFDGAILGPVASSVMLACLIVPGVVLAGVAILTLVLIVDKQIGFWPAFKLGGAAISRRWGRFFGFMLVLALINAAGMMAVFIGFLVTAPITLAAFIFAYEDLFSAASRPGPLAAECGTPIDTAVKDAAPPSPANRTEDSARRLLRSSASFVTSPEQLGTFAGQFFLWRRKSQMVLEDRQLAFGRAGTTTVIPLHAIRDLSIGHYPRVMNPAGLDFISVTYDAGGQTRRIFFSPCESIFGLPSQFNQFVAEWFNAIRAAVVAATGCEPGNTPAGQLGVPPGSKALCALLLIPLLLGGISVIALARQSTGGDATRSFLGGLASSIITITENG